jgi:hypothetical protein
MTMGYVSFVHKLRSKLYCGLMCLFSSGLCVPLQHGNQVP